LLFVLALLSVLPASNASAQEYPTKPIRIIVGQAPGAITDLLARVIAPGMSKDLGQPMIVENRPGADLVIAFGYVANQAPADGHTLTIVTSGIASLRAFTKNPPFDPVEDLPPVSRLIEGPQLLVSSYAVPWNTFPEMIAYAKANPDKVNFGTPGLRTQPALDIVSIKRKHGVDIVHVPFSGGSVQAIQAIMANNVQLSFGMTISAAKQAAADHRVKMMAISGPQRNKDIPDVPTFTELGLPEVKGFFMSLNVRKGTPKPIMDRLYKAVTLTMRSPEVQNFTQKAQYDVIATSPEESAKYFAETSALYTAIAKSGGIQPE
jgi:tripartite-type tricarboxylate transporter receptor subunit TctC